MMSLSASFLIMKVRHRRFAAEPTQALVVPAEFVAQCKRNILRGIILSSGLLETAMMNY